MLRKPPACCGRRCPPPSGTASTGRPWPWSVAPLSTKTCKGASPTCSTRSSTPRPGKPVSMYLLFEHQSSPDPWMRLRLLRYGCRIWEADRRDDPDRRELRPIVPVVFYQGARDWNHSTAFSDLFPEAARGLAVGTPVRSRAPGPDDCRSRRGCRRRQGPHHPVADDGGVRSPRGHGAADDGATDPVAKPSQGRGWTNSAASSCT